jgi:hypothetical protein
MDAPVVRLYPKTHGRHLDVLKWGLAPCFTKDLTKARKPTASLSLLIRMKKMLFTAIASVVCLR